MKKVLAGTVLLLALAACGTDKTYPVPSPTAAPDSSFSKVVDNPLFPLPPGREWKYKSKTPEGTETVTVSVGSNTKVVDGVECIEVRDIARLGKKVIEDTVDWFAQDKLGNVWYFGEATAEFEDGKQVSTAGSWEAGVNGAKRGIVMEAHPKVGDSYYQEYAVGEAEDQATVLGVGISQIIKNKVYAGVLVTKDFTNLDPDSAETKMFAPGVGLIRATNLKDGQVEELVSMTDM